MSLTEAIIGIGMAMTCAMSCAAPLLACPQSVPTKSGRAPLVLADVFDGPPEDMASQIPDLRTFEWELASSQDDAKQRGRPYYLVCRYKKTALTVTFKIPYEVKSCKLDGIKGGVAVACR